jgi:hypothetical protein
LVKKLVESVEMMSSVPWVSKLGVKRMRSSMVAEEVLLLEAKRVEKPSWHSAWVHGTSVLVDDNLGELGEGYRIDPVSWQEYP